MKKVVRVIVTHLRGASVALVDLEYGDTGSLVAGRLNICDRQHNDAFIDY